MGSLFKARDYWTVKLGNDEEADRGGLALGNIDNDSNGSEKIVIGTFQGTLRMYHPKGKGYRADDLLLEQVLEAPILQVSIGKFIPNSTVTALCILHPRKVVVYVVQRSGGGDSSDPFGRHYQLNRAYAHVLERSAYNMVHGAFTGQGRECFIVQSLDGFLGFYEQDKALFGRFLPSSSFLVPGPLAFSLKSETLLTCTSTFEVECYRFSTLAMSSASESRDDPAMTTGSKLTPDWSCNLGEEMIALAVTRVSTELAPGQWELVVLGERTLYFLSESTGEMRSQKRLDYFPSFLHPFLVDSENARYHLLIGSHTGSLMVYNDRSLLWAAKFTSVPLGIAVATLCKVEGMIVVLGDDNTVSVNYLGTDPATQPVQLLESKELDYESMDEEHCRLQAIIRQNVHPHRPQTKNMLQLSCELLPPRFTANANNFDAGGGSWINQRECMVHVTLHYDGAEDVEQIMLAVQTQLPITVRGDSAVHIPLLQSGSTRTPIVVPFIFVLSNDAERMSPASLMVEVFGTYSLSSGEPMTCRSQVLLPLYLVASLTSPVKNATHKLTFDTNRAPPPLGSLFGDFVELFAEPLATPVALTVVYANGQDATILVSRNAGRYRVQSNWLDSLWTLSSELVRRLRDYFVPNREGSAQDASSVERPDEPFKIEFQDAIPFADFFSIMDAHFEARIQLKEVQQKLDNRAHQFRSIQKRLLVRYKDRNPSPLFGLDILFEETFRQLIDVADEVTERQLDLQRAQNQLACSVHLLLLLLRYQIGPSFRREDFRILQSHLSPIVQDNSQQGWEESIDAAMTHLLRTVLAKNIKESSSMPQPIQIPSETSKLKKHITLVLDRITKGGQLADNKNWEIHEPARKRTDMES